MDKVVHEADDDGGGQVEKMDGPNEVGTIDGRARKTI